MILAVGNAVCQGQAECLHLAMPPLGVVLTSEVRTHHFERPRPFRLDISITNAQFKCGKLGLSKYEKGGVLTLQVTCGGVFRLARRSSSGLLGAVVWAWLTSRRVCWLLGLSLFPVSLLTTLHRLLIYTYTVSRLCGTYIKSNGLLAPAGGLYSVRAGCEQRLPLQVHR